jgi:endonuclease/exonuclease/phosphatase family metal-dependent hydrolase
MRYLADPAFPCPEPPPLIRIMTYNVHGCRGRDRKWLPQRIAEVVASAEPDIVALQELDAGRPRSGKVDQAEMIALALGMKAQFFPAMQVLEEKYGDAILTACPSRLVKAGPLPKLPGVARYEFRGALWASITVGDGEVQVINTHLGLRAREQRRQIETLLGPEWLGHPDCGEAVVLLGDFNAPPRSPSYRRLTARLDDAQRRKRGRGQPTFPARFPTLRLDYAFVGPAIEVQNVQTIRTPLARVASDHLPLVVDLEIVPARMQQAAQ